MMDNYVDHNCSVTISYDTTEIPSIIEWIMDNWDSYVGVSFIYRNDPTKTAKDLGYPYLPQEVVTQEEYTAYASTLLTVDLDAGNSLLELEEADCATGACPIR
jgi:ribonucleoside-triphosphate reductase